MKIKINEDAFKGCTYWNGKTAILDTDKKPGSAERGNPIIGKSGNTKRFTIKSGGGLYLEDIQYSVISE